MHQEGDGRVRRFIERAGSHGSKPGNPVLQVLQENINVYGIKIKQIGQFLGKQDKAYLQKHVLKAIFNLFSLFANLKIRSDTA
jgi:hypothetical protein